MTRLCTQDPTNGPSVALLSWPEASPLFGIDAQGGVYRSEDRRQTSNHRGALDGPPEAFLATTTLLYAAVHEKGIFVSDDDGTSWRAFYQDPQGANVR